MPHFLTGKVSALLRQESKAAEDEVSCYIMPVFPEG